MDEQFFITDAEAAEKLSLGIFKAHPLPEEVVMVKGVFVDSKRGIFKEVWVEAVEGGYLLSRVEQERDEER